MRPFASIYTHHTAYCLLVLLLTANFCQRHCTVRGNRFGLKEHHYVSSNRDAATRDPDIAWIVQTGQSTAREAVVAKLLTTLQNEHNIGLVADVQSDDTIPLVDTGHRVQNWSQEHWAAEVARNGQQAVEHRTGALSQTHPQYYQHWAFKVLAGFDAAYKRCSPADAPVACPATHFYRTSML